MNGHGVRVDDVRECRWCYRRADWCADTPRHGFIDLCQHHYGNLQSELAAARFARLSDASLAVMRGLDALELSMTRLDSGTLGESRG